MSSIISLLVDNADIAVFKIKLTFALKYVSSLFDSYASLGRFIATACNTMFPLALFFTIDLFIPVYEKLFFGSAFIAIYPPFLIIPNIFLDNSVFCEFICGMINVIFGMATVCIYDS